jgi:hypothetical protein
MIIETESDVRDWLRAQLGTDRLFWVEAQRGATLGFPDCVAALPHGRCAFLELKRCTLKDGWLKFTWRAVQRRIARHMHAQGMTWGMVVGVVGSGDVYALKPKGEFDAAIRANLLSGNDTKGNLMVA